jgi:hypothetical protein
MQQSFSILKDNVGTTSSLHQQPENDEDIHKKFYVFLNVFLDSQPCFKIDSLKKRLNYLKIKLELFLENKQIETALEHAKENDCIDSFIKLVHNINTYRRYKEYPEGETPFVIIKTQLGQISIDFVETLPKPEPKPKTKTINTSTSTSTSTTSTNNNDGKERKGKGGKGRGVKNKYNP